MSEPKKNGFTLVELLAVIVILAIILVIAVPQIMNVITESRKGALISSAKLIAASVESAKLSNEILEIENTITCEAISQINEEDYESCSIKILGDTPYVSLVGKGKFDEMSVCYGTKEKAVLIEESTCPPLAVEKIESLATDGNIEGLITDDTADQNIRYAGASPKNYVNFNGEDWRIIGIFNVQTSYGIEEKLMKIVRDSSIGYMSWDSSARSVNNGYGVNEWTQADLMTMLNTYYIGTSATCSYCSGSGQEACLNDCSSSVIQIGNTYASMIEEVVWNTGAFTSDASGRTGQSALTAYNAERGTINGKKCTSGAYCNDSVARTTIWTGKVGLIYPSDYGYSSTNVDCRNWINAADEDKRYCADSNWLARTVTYWTISPGVFSNDNTRVWTIINNGHTVDYAAGRNGGGWNVFPTMYLKSNVLITNGEGTKERPYQLSIA